jgi:REP element-mobilizing transposase RayT
MTRKPETVAFWRGRLPHWEVVDGRYFVTIHVAGAIPKQGQERIHAIAAELDKLKGHQDPRRLRIQRRIFAEMEAWLDRATWVDYLKRPEIAEMVVEAIAHRHQCDWQMYEFVVMPSHVHLFFEISGSVTLSRVDQGRLKIILEQFKRWTGHEAGKLLTLDGSRFWQDEWFDHWSLSDEEDEKIIAYIRRNPQKAGLVQNYKDWPYGSWRGN